MNHLLSFDVSFYQAIAALLIQSEESIEFDPMRLAFNWVYEIVKKQSLFVIRFYNLH